MLDLEKLSLILTIDNANMLRINPELLEASKNQDEEKSNSEDGRLDWLAAQVNHKSSIFYWKTYYNENWLSVYSIQGLKTFSISAQFGQEKTFEDLKIERDKQYRVSA